MHGNPGVGRQRGGRLMCIFMPPFFPHLFVSAYQTDRHTVTRPIQEQHLGARICFQKWHRCAFSPPSLFFLASPIKAIPIRSATLQPDAPVFAELGYRDDSLAGETREQTIARVCITTPADSCVKETQGSFVPSEDETLSWRS